MKLLTPIWNQTISFLLGEIVVSKIHQDFIISFTFLAKKLDLCKHSSWPQSGIFKFNIRTHLFMDLYKNLLSTPKTFVANLLLWVFSEVAMLNHLKHIQFILLVSCYSMAQRIWQILYDVTYFISFYNTPKSSKHEHSQLKYLKDFRPSLLLPTYILNP